MKDWEWPLPGLVPRSFSNGRMVEKSLRTRLAAATVEKKRTFNAMFKLN